MKSDQGSNAAETLDLREDYTAILYSALRYEIERKMAGNDGKTLIYVHPNFRRPAYRVLGNFLERNDQGLMYKVVGGFDLE